MEKVNILRDCQPQSKRYTAGIALLPHKEAQLLISLGLATKVTEPKKKYKVQEPTTFKDENIID